MPRITSNETVIFNIDNTIVHGLNRVEYIASVKNSPQGKEWIKTLRKLNPKYSVVYFSTGANRRERFELAGKEMRTYQGVKGRYDAGFKLPASVADRFRVYVKTKPERGEYSRNLTIREVILP